MFVRRQARWWRAKLCIAPLEEFPQEPSIDGNETICTCRFPVGRIRPGRRIMWQNIHPKGLIPLYRTSPPSGVAKHSDSTPLDEHASGTWILPPANGIRDGAWLRDHWH